MKYKIDYAEMFKSLLDGKSYQVESECKNLAIQAVKAKFGFNPEVNISSGCKYAIISL